MRINFTCYIVFRLPCVIYRAYRNMPSNHYKPYDDPTPPSSRPTSTPNITRGSTPPHSRPSSGHHSCRNQDMGEDRPVSLHRGTRGPTPPHSRSSSGLRLGRNQDMGEDRPVSLPRGTRETSTIKSRPPSGARPARDKEVDRERGRDSPPSGPLARLDTDKSLSLSHSIQDTSQQQPSPGRNMSILNRPPAINVTESPIFPTDDIPSVSPHTAHRKSSVVRSTPTPPVVKKL